MARRKSESKLKNFLRRKVTFESRRLLTYKDGGFYVIKEKVHGNILWVYYYRIGWYKNTTLFSDDARKLQDMCQPSKRYIEKNKLWLKELINK